MKSGVQFGTSYNDSNISDYTLPSGVLDETSDVQKYGGFYIGRYEAGVPDNQTTIDGTADTTSNVAGIPTNKKGKASWTYINYTNSKANAESMYNTSTSVKSGLLTGKAWDTTCKWIENSGKDITDSSAYGNYYNSTFTYTSLDGTNATKVINLYNKIPTGSTEYTKVNNIYDLAGNVWNGQLRRTFLAVFIVEAIITTMKTVFLFRVVVSALCLSLTIA